jgi:hypothetical protein
MSNLHLFKVIPKLRQHGISIMEWEYSFLMMTDSGSCHDSSSASNMPLRNGSLFHTDFNLF